MSPMWHQFSHNMNMSAFEDHSPGHNQTDIAASKNNDIPSWHFTVNIDKLLSGSG